MNVFDSKVITESDAMKNLFIEMKEIQTRICLLAAEEHGENLDIEHLIRNIHAATEFNLIYFKSTASTVLKTQPITNLPLSERIAIAAHEAYTRINK